MKLLNAYICGILICASLRAGGAVLDEEFASAGYAMGGAAWLKPARQARSAALRGAAAAGIADLAGLQYNPALLDDADTLYYTALVAREFQSMDRNRYGVDLISGGGRMAAWGLSYTGIRVGDIEERDTAGALQGTFGYQTGAIAASAAGRLRIPLSLGVRVRYLFETMYRQRADGFGIDAGALYRPLNSLQMSLSLRNIGSRLWWSTGHADDILMSGRFAVAGLLLDRSLRMEIDFEKTMDQPPAGMMGIEYTYRRILALRAGVSSAVNTGERLVRKPDYAFGIGIRHELVGFDYAFTVPASGLGFGNLLSVFVNILPPHMW